MTSDDPDPISVAVHCSLSADELAASQTDPDLDRWRDLAAASLRTEGVASGELDLSFVSPAEMTELNEGHMGKVGPTDVLAFPIDGEDTDPMPGVPVLLGDVIVCPAVAHENAQGDGKATDDEIALLIVHGVLHVLGHDHQDPAETERMQSREKALLSAHHRS